MPSAHRGYAGSASHSSDPFATGGLVTLTNEAVVGPRSDEGKIAKKFVASINTITFNAEAFAYILITSAGDGLKDRIMQIVKALIHNYARHYDAGDMRDSMRDAKRLKDTLDQFGM